jgi:putative endonuclease
MSETEKPISTAKKLHNREVGQWGEDLAADFLTRAGYQILERNARTHAGELDIVARHMDAIVFIEVKTRTRILDVYPEDALTPKKVDHLLNSAQEYLEAHPELPDEWKIEVVAVNGNARKFQIEHFNEVSYGS